MKGNIEYYAILSGEHPTLPLGELEALLEARHGGSIIYSFDGIALLGGVRDPQAIPLEAGMVKEVGRVYYVVEADIDNIKNSLRMLGEMGYNFSKIIVKKYKRYSDHIDAREIKDSAPKGRGGVLRIFITEGVAVIGTPLMLKPSKSFINRRPRTRPFFKPGPLSPQLSRVFVNLSRLKEDMVFLDPFCGTGGFILEACLLGAKHCICGDLSRDMVRGSLINLKHYGFTGKSTIIWQDSASMPIRDEAIDAIATDPPYGRSTTTGRREYSELVSEFLGEAHRVLREEGYIVFAGPAEKSPYHLAEEAGFKIISRFQMFVHSTLTREIVVARK